MTKWLKQFLSARFIFNYLGIAFLLCLFYFAYLLFQNRNSPVIFKEEKKKDSYYHFSQKLSQIQLCYKNKRYHLAIKLCEKLEEQRIDKKKRHSVLLLKAACQKSAGLYHTALAVLDEADALMPSPLSHFLRGVIHEHLGDEREAIRSFENAYRADPFYFYAYEKLGDLFFRRGDYQEAIKAYEGRGNYRGKISETTELKLSLMNLLAGNHRAAAQYAHKYIETAHGKKYLAYSYFLRGLSREQMENWIGAEADFHKAVDLAPLETKDLITYYHSLFLVKNDRLSESIEELRSLIDSKKGSSRVSGLLAQIYFREKNYLESYRYFKNFLKEEQSLSALYYHCVSAYKLKKYREAALGFDEFLKKNPLKDHGLSASILLSLCHAHFGKYHEAFKVLNAALQDHGEHPQIIKTLGQLILKHEPERFYKTMAKYLDQPELKELNLLLAEHYLRKKKIRPALNTLMEYAQHGPLPSDLSKAIGDVHLELRDHHNALFYYTRALREEDSKKMKAQIINNQSFCYWQLGKKDRGLNLLEKARGFSPDEPGIYYNLALSAKETDYLRYRHMLSKAATLATQSHDPRLRSLIYLEKGFASLKEEKIAKARDYFQKALEDDPDNHVAEFNLKKLG